MLAGQTQENNEIHLRLHFTLHKSVNVGFFFLYFAENLNSISERNNKQSDKKEGGKKFRNAGL